MNKTMLSKRQLEVMMASDDESVKLVQKKRKSGSSEWWQYYHHIVVDDKQQPFVSCNNCKSLLAFSSANGTNNLRSHFISCTKRKDKSVPGVQRTVRDFYLSSTKCEIPERTKEAVTQACTEFCAVDSRAFDLITGSGFQNLAKVLFDAGRRHYKGNFDMKDLLPHPTTISRNVAKLYEDAKAALISICQDLNNFCIIVDQWTESFTGSRTQQYYHRENFCSKSVYCISLGIGYCGIALRFVHDDWKLHSYILGCYPYNALDHSAPQLREFVNRKLVEYNLKLDSTKYVVTDNEPKMIAAFRDQSTRIGCSDHYLNKQLQHAFESEQIHVNRTTVEKVDCDVAQNVFQNVKKVANTVRRTHQQQNLSRKLQIYSDTRFNGAFLMMNVFKELFLELPAILVNSKWIANYYSIDKDVLDQICDLLIPYQEVIEALSEDQRPSLHRVIPLRHCLIRKCFLKEEDHPGIIQLKVFLERRMKNAWLITNEHRLATILHPKLKHFECCPEEKEKSIDVLKIELQNYQTIVSSSNKRSPDSTHSTPPAASVTSMDHSTIKRKNLLVECFDSKVLTTSTPKNPYKEIEDYFVHQTDENFDVNYDNQNDYDVLAFWKKHQHVFSGLSSIAKRVFAIPASNTIIERLFSASKNVVTGKRTSLGSEKINQLVFLQKNLAELKPYIIQNNRKRASSISSSTTVSSEDSSSTSAKQRLLEYKNICSDCDSVDGSFD